MKTFFIIIAIVFVGASIYAGPVFAVPPAPWEIDMLIGRTAPDFTLNDLNGRRISLLDYRGKVVFLNFWATWCPPCKEEVPSLNNLLKKYTNRDFALISISSDNSKSEIAEFVKTHKIKFIVLHDKDGKVSKDYKVFSIPLSFLIDKRGRIVERYFGINDWLDKKFLRKIDGLM